MAKRSYLGQLGRWFVRSAVGQVGRDGGRVISNQIYGDAHSTPIRGVGDAQVQVPPLPGYTQQQQSSELEYVPVGKDFPIWIVAMIVTCGLAAIVAFFKGLHYSNKGTVTYKRYEVEQVPIIDRRYKTGVRGYTTQAGYKTYEIPINEANPADVKQQKSAGRRLMIAGGVVLLIMLCAIFNVKPDEHFRPAMLFTIPLIASYIYVLWKPSTLDFIGGSNAKRRIIASIVFILLYAAGFMLHEKYVGHHEQRNTEIVATDPTQ